MPEMSLNYCLRNKNPDYMSFKIQIRGIIKHKKQESKSYHKRYEACQEIIEIFILLNRDFSMARRKVMNTAQWSLLDNMAKASSKKEFQAANIV